MSTAEVESAPQGQIKLSDLNAWIRGAGAHRPAEVLANLIGVIGLRVLALEVQGNGHAQIQS